VSIVLADRRKATKLKIGVAILVTAINISVYNIWIPARLQIAPEYERINQIWERCEKGIYLVAGAALIWYFICVVQQKPYTQGIGQILQTGPFQYVDHWLLVEYRLFDYRNDELEELFRVGLAFPKHVDETELMFSTDW
jgi:hypothetical protein